MSTRKIPKEPITFTTFNSVKSFPKQEVTFANPESAVIFALHVINEMWKIGMTTNNAKIAFYGTKDANKYLSKYKYTGERKWLSKTFYQVDSTEVSENSPADAGKTNELFSKNSSQKIQEHQPSNDGGAFFQMQIISPKSDSK